MVGTFVRLKLGTALIVGESTHDLKSDTTLVETSSKDTGNDSSFEYGRNKKTISVTGMAGTNAETTKMGWHEALAAQAAMTKVAITMGQFDPTAGTPVPGTISYAGNCLIQSVSETSPDDANCTFSLTLQVDGKLTPTVVPTNP